VIDALINACWLIPILPLVGGLVSIVGGPRLAGWNHLPVIFGIGASFLLSFILLLGAPQEATTIVYPWIDIQAPGLSESWALSIPIEFRLDGLTAMMLGMVTFVSTLVGVFSAGYMKGDPGYPRFFFLFGLFVFSMTGLVLSNNFLLTYGFWEGVGVCSYLLIGYWYSKPAAASAAKKAFLVNRVGDFGFAVALFLMWTHVPGHDLSYDAVLSGATVEALSPNVRFWIVFLLFWAATAKSAQIPLYVWLPDAMEGPTPVSALIHAATMVTAGVYLLARSSLLLAAEPFVLAAVSVIGGLTALWAALIALTQFDLKRVLAYSTISQLGYMFMGVGAAVGDLATFAVVAAVFHLFTHAFFKALLFLGSGSVMHAMGNVIDMRQFGGLRHRMPYTCWTFAIGALALGGIFPLAGFWSKDEILVALKFAGHGDGGYASAYTAVYWIAMFTAGLTAFYTGRAFFLTFFGPEKLPERSEAHGHDHEHGHGHEPGEAHEDHFGHESPRIMTVPLIVLAVGAALVGLLFGPLTGWFAGLVEATPSLPHPEHHEGHPVDWGSVILGTLVGLAGLGLSAWFYLLRRDLPERISKALGPFARASERKFLVDEVYEAVFVQPTRALAALSRFVDVYILDGLVRLVAHVPLLLGRYVLRPLQSGLVQSYVGLTAISLAILLVVLLLR